MNSGLLYKALGLPDPDVDGYIASSQVGAYYYIIGTYPYQTSGEDSYYIKSDLAQYLSKDVVVSPQYGFISKVVFISNPGEALHYLDESEFSYEIGRLTNIYSMMFELCDYNGVVQKKTDMDDWSLSMSVVRDKS